MKSNIVATVVLLTASLGQAGEEMFLQHDLIKNDSGPQVAPHLNKHHMVPPLGRRGFYDMMIL